MITANGALTQVQRALADNVCTRVRSMDLRVRALARAVWTGEVTREDGQAVYGWLVLLGVAEQLDRERGAA
jgi:hypothetical protein